MKNGSLCLVLLFLLGMVVLQAEADGVFRGPVLEPGSLFVPVAEDIVSTGDLGVPVEKPAPSDEESTTPHWKEIYEIAMFQTGAAKSPKKTWSIFIIGTSRPVSYDYTLVRKVESGGESMYFIVAEKEDSPSRTYSYTFRENGEYELWVTVTDQKGSRLSEQFPIHIDLPGMDRLDVSLMELNRNYISEKTVWAAKATGGKGEYRYSFYLTDRTTGTDSLMGCEIETKNSIYSYQFVSNGNYRLAVYVYDKENNVAYTSLDFTVDVDGKSTVDQVADRLMKQCETEGNKTQYEKAVWAHEWLVTHADYDSTLTYYAEDGVLIYGKGVCDSYTKAFRLLMNKAGIPCDRIVSKDGSHSWDQVCLDGNWYNVDLTWDDPQGGTENHTYCFITDEAIRSDHMSYESSRSCDAVEDNYFVREGTAGPWITELTERINTGLGKGDYSYEVPLADRYRAEGLTHTSGPVWITAREACLSYMNEAEYSDGKESVQLKLIPDREKNTVTASIDFEDTTLQLPPFMKVIEEEAFEGNVSIRAAVIPEGTVTIGSRAFKNCTGLWKVVIPSTVKTVAEDAFDTDNGHLTIVTDKGSPAENFARKKGLKYTNE